MPPDYFSAQGQLWGNPIYDWDALVARGYRWCIDRLRALLAHVDVIRLDHFRAFAAAWHIPAEAPTAQSGRWVPGPGAEFFGAVEKALGGLPFIAEDLGLITPDVSALRDEFHLPGTRVLQFAFDGHADNPHLPDNYVPNTVVYTGTHDNPTTRGWYEDLPDAERGNLWSYLRRAPGTSAEVAPALLRPGVVVGRRPRDRAAAGRAQPRQGGANERARQRRGQLALARHRRDAVPGGLRIAARPDPRLGSHRARDGGRVMSVAPIVFLVDVDNTLLGNDRIQDDLKRHLEREFGAASRDRYWAILEELFVELGYRDYLGALQRHRTEHPHDVRLMAVSSYLVDYPFADRLYPGALDVLQRFRA